MIHYDVKGKEKALFFIHGWGCDSRVWINQKEALSSKYRVITADLRGHGKSEWKSTDNLLDAFARDTATLCERLNINNVNFIGWSLGCYVIFKLLEIIPEIINSIILIGGSPKFLKSDDFKFGFEVEDLRLMKRRLNRDFGDALLDFRRSIFIENEVNETNFRNLLKMLNKNPQPNKDALILGLDMLRKTDFRNEIKRFDIPTLVVCGEDDSITPKGASEYMHNAIKNSSLVIIKDAGHAPFLTKPNEFNRILERWIDER